MGSIARATGVAGSGLLSLVFSACGGAPPPSALPVVAHETKSPPAQVVFANGDCTRRQPGIGPVRASLERRGAAVALARIGKDVIAYVADEDGRVLHTVSLDRGTQLGRTPLAGAPAQALVLADGRVAVTLRDKSVVQVLEPGEDLGAPLASLCEVDVAAEAWGLAATPDDARVLVTSGWGAELGILDGSTLATLRSMSLPREPRSVVVDDGGKRAFVSHAVGAHVSVVELEHPERGAHALDVGVSSGVRGKLDEDVRRVASQGYALAKVVVGGGDSGEQPKLEGRVPRVPRPARRPGRAPPPPLRDRIYVPMTSVDPGTAFERSNAYYGSAQTEDPRVTEPLVGVVDATRERVLTRDLLKRRDLGRGNPCVLPRAAGVDGVSGTLLVACVDIDAVLELDARASDPMRMELRRWHVRGGPTGIAIDEVGRRAVVWSQFDPRVTIIDLGRREAISTVWVDSRPPADVVALQRGRMLFHQSSNESISANGLACASCHPDGRDDGLTWATSSGPRQTLMLAGRVGSSGPYGWQGQHAALPQYVGATVLRLGGRAPEGDQIVASLVQFVAAVPAPPTGPRGIAGDALARGRALFFDEAQGCASCHVGGQGTDGLTHDVGSAIAADGADSRFDTPSLRFVARTAPYFHDGRYPTLADLLAAPYSKMGHTAHLDALDRAALATFLESL